MTGDRLEVPIASKACFGVTRMLQQLEGSCLNPCFFLYSVAEPAGKKVFIVFRDDKKNSSEVVGVVFPDDAALAVRRDRQFGSGCRDVLGVPASCTVVNTLGAHELVEHFY